MGRLVSSFEIGCRVNPIQTPCQATNAGVWQRISVEGESVVGGLGDRGGAYWLQAAARSGLV